MNVTDHLSGISGIWRGCVPAPAGVITSLVAVAPIALPESYVALLAVTNGGEGDLGIEPGWIDLWPAEEVMSANAEYAVAENLPGLFGFGSNGGGELLAFDARRSPPWPIVMIPFIPMEVAEAVQIAQGFDELLLEIGEPANDR